MLFEKRGSTSWKAVAVLIVVTFGMSFLMADLLKVNTSQAQVNGLPSPTRLLPLSEAWSAPLLRGLRLNPDNPLSIEFIIDTADKGTVTADEAGMLIRYFLAALTLPEEELWVNLSPYEEERTVPERLASTDMGRDLLSQDYVLKQLLSSLTYPESATGKAFWTKTYKQVLDVAGTTSLPVNTFNKVWILPDKALVYENMGLALIKDATLKVMGEEDYLAMDNNVAGIKSRNSDIGDELIDQVSEVSSSVMKDVMLPKVYDDVNYGRNFANLRQIYNSLILARWFKEKFKSSFYAHYMNKGKVHGIDMAAPDAKDKIYKLYCEAFEKGVFDYIKKEYDPGEKTHVKRRYFSGGMAMGEVNVDTYAASAVEMPRAFSSSSVKPVVVNTELDPLDSGPLSEEEIKRRLDDAGVLSVVSDSPRVNLSDIPASNNDKTAEIPFTKLTDEQRALARETLAKAIGSTGFKGLIRRLLGGGSSSVQRLSAGAIMITVLLNAGAVARNPWRVIGSETISDKNGIRTEIIHTPRAGKGQYYIERISYDDGREPFQRVVIDRDMQEILGLEFREFAGEYGKRVLRMINNRGESRDGSGDGSKDTSGVKPTSMSDPKDFNKGGIDLQSLEVDAIEGSSPLLYQAPFDPRTFDGFEMRVTSLERFNSPEAMLASFM